MTTIKLKNWRDENSDGASKAKKLLESEDLTVDEISKFTSVSSEQISRLKNSPQELEEALNS